MWSIKEALNNRTDAYRLAYMLGAKNKQEADKDELVIMRQREVDKALKSYGFNAE